MNTYNTDKRREQRGGKQRRRAASLWPTRKWEAAASGESVADAIAALLGLKDAEPPPGRKFEPEGMFGVAFEEQKEQLVVDSMTTANTTRRHHKLMRRIRKLRETFVERYGKEPTEVRMSRPDVLMLWFRSNVKLRDLAACGMRVIRNSGGLSVSGRLSAGFSNTLEEEPPKRPWWERAEDIVKGVVAAEFKHTSLSVNGSWDAAAQRLAISLSVRPSPPEAYWPPRYACLVLIDARAMWHLKDDDAQDEFVIDRTREVLSKIPVIDPRDLPEAPKVGGGPVWEVRDSQSEAQQAWGGVFNG